MSPRWLAVLAVLIPSFILPPSSLGGDQRAAAAAVDRGLVWLATQQRPDGSWSADAALNALPLLAFLSAGHVPGDRSYDQLLERGCRFVLSQQAADGSFLAGGAMMYGHGITTLLLAELNGMSRENAAVRAALTKAVVLILRAQAVPKSDLQDGGWRYDPTSTDSDLSVTIWQITALKAASDVGVTVPRSAMDRATAYVRRCEHPQGGFGYQPGGLPNQSRTAAAMVALRLGGPENDPSLGRARRWLTANPLRWDSPFFYYAAYHCAHAGAGQAENVLLARQSANGSWPASPHAPDAAKAGPVYTTAIAVLALTADWNYLPGYLH